MRWITLALALSMLITCSASVRAGAIEGTVVWVDDGDTIDVRIGDRVERVRYIGMDAPEVPHHGEGGTRGGVEAAALNRALVAGKHVTLELDAELRDHYGRMLAYVWIDGVMANLEMVVRGFARTLTIPPNVRYQHAFAEAERQARAEGIGLWGSGELASNALAALPAMRLPRPAAIVHHMRHAPIARQHHAHSPHHATHLTRAAPFRRA
jgi:micrococcal nuclease